MISTEHILELTMLYDFYGELLTDRQREVFEMYNFSDLSLGEIGGELGITPQGARDFLKRTEKSLADYEAALGLLEKHAARRQKIEEISAIVEATGIGAAEKSLIKEKLSELL